MRIDRIKFAIELVRQDMNTTEVADKAGLSRATVSSVKRGASCNTETAIKIANALGVELETILEER